jgi:hypothetical protein
MNMSQSPNRLTIQKSNSLSHLESKSLRTPFIAVNSIKQANVMAGELVPTEHVVCMKVSGPGTIAMALGLNDTAMEIVMKAISLLTNRMVKVFTLG